MKTKTRRAAPSWVWFLVGAGVTAAGIYGWLVRHLARDQPS